MLRKIPNNIGVLVLGIVSIPTCMCYGIIGMACGIISLVLHSQGMKAYNANPEEFDASGLGNMKAGKICAIIGMCLSALYLIAIIIAFATLGTLDPAALRELQNV